jgi:AraC-like DNA-binding protein
MLGSRGPRIVEGDVFRRLLRARDAMAARHEAPLVLREAAEVAGFSPFHFHRLFSRVFDETPAAYVRRLRLERARERMARGASVTEACFDVGYASLGSFSLLFAQRYGLPPSQWRRTARRMIAVPEVYARLYVPCCFFPGPQSPRSNPAPPGAH